MPDVDAQRFSRLMKLDVDAGNYVTSLLRVKVFRRKLLEFSEKEKDTLLTFSFIIESWQSLSPRAAVTSSRPMSLAL